MLVGFKSYLQFLDFRFNQVFGFTTCIHHLFLRETSRAILEQEQFRTFIDFTQLL